MPYKPPTGISYSRRGTQVSQVFIPCTWILSSIRAFHHISWRHMRFPLVF